MMHGARAGTPGARGGRGQQCAARARCRRVPGAPQRRAAPARLRAVGFDARRSPMRRTSIRASISSSRSMTRESRWCRSACRCRRTSSGWCGSRARGTRRRAFSGSSEVETANRGSAEPFFHALDLRGFFGYCWLPFSPEPTMMRTPNLEAKLELLMSLAGDDREGLPTQAAAAPAPARERRGRAPSAESAAGAHRTAAVRARRSCASS